MIVHNQQGLGISKTFQENAEGFWIQDVSRKNLADLIPIIEGQAHHHNVEFDSNAFTLKRALFGEDRNAEARLIMHSNYEQPVGFILFNHIHTPHGYGFDMEDIHVAEWFRTQHAGGGSYGFGKLLQIARESHCDFIEWSLTKNNAGYAMDFYTKRCEAKVLSATEYDVSHMLEGGKRYFDRPASAYSVEVVRTLDQVAQTKRAAESIGADISKMEKSMMITITQQNNDSYICRDKSGEVVAVSFGNRCLSTITGENLYGVTTPVFLSRDENAQKRAWMSMMQGVQDYARGRGDVDLLTWSADNTNMWELQMLSALDSSPMVLEHGNMDSSFLRFRVEEKNIYGDLPERLVVSREFDPVRSNALATGGARVGALYAQGSDWRAHKIG